MILRLISVLALVFLSAAALADQSPLLVEKTSKVLDRARSTLDEVEKDLGQPVVNENLLRRLRDRMLPLPGELQEVIDRLTPRLQAVDARLKEMGSPSDDAKPATPEAPAAASPAVPAVAPASADKTAAGAAPKTPAKPAATLPKPPAASSAPALAPVAAPVAVPAPDSAAAGINAEWTEQRKLYDEIDATLKRARALLVETRQTLVLIVARQRALFAKTLFLQAKGIFSPALWKEAVAEAPKAGAAAWDFIKERAANLGSRLNSSGKFEFLGLALLIVLMIPPATLLPRRVLARDEDIRNPGKNRIAAAAAWTALVTIAVPLLATFAFNSLLDEFDLVDASLEPVIERLTEGVGRVAVAYGFARALLAPDHPHWRLVNPGDPLAARLTRLATAVVVVLSITGLIEQIEETVQAALGVVIVTRALGALVCAAITAAVLVTFPHHGEMRSDARRDWIALTRLLGVGSVIVVVGACSLGYVTFALFFIVQLCWTLIVVATLSIALRLTRWGAEAAFAPSGFLGRVGVNILGIDRRSLGAFSELTAGAFSLALFGLAALLLLASLGIESGYFLANLQSSFLAVKIGEMTVSPSSVLASAALFAVMLAATQGLRKWLDSRFLPLTRLDSGLRNSIGTSVYYAGFILAASIALSQLGIGFEKLAIVAGALSVGIGFGLQSIVNNFVSGLILLWERVVRVGDWVVIGDEQGYVKRINVRSTEIETFDRATMIVPNSNLVTGVVKNWLRGDKMGRIKIALAPSSAADPEQIRDILLAAAKAQEGVLRIPAPQVMFLAMEADLYRFELWCFVEDVQQATRVRSDLHFDLHKRLAEAGIRIGPEPLPPTVVQFPGLDKFAAAAGAVVVEQKLIEDEFARIAGKGEKSGELAAHA
jgi:potassium-dependent mechanosensitive channel